MATQKKKKVLLPRWYDFYDDWALIEASIAQQYGIRVRQVIDTISWSEMCTYISGLLPDTPLGKIIQIRSEENKEILKSFTPDMLKERRNWRNKQAKEKLNDTEKLDAMFNNMEKMLEVLFSD